MRKVEVKRSKDYETMLNGYYHGIEIVNGVSCFLVEEGYLITYPISDFRIRFLDLPEDKLIDDDKIDAFQPSRAVLARRIELLERKLITNESTYTRKQLEKSIRDYVENSFSMWHFHFKKHIVNGFLAELDKVKVKDDKD